MKKTIFVLAFVWVCSLAAFSQNKCLEQMFWLEGKWTGKLDSQEFVEDWKIMNGQLVGKGYLMSTTHDTISSEDLFINCNNNGTIDYMASPTEDYYVNFVSTEAGPNENYWSFENPENSFPKKIKYQRISANELEITISDETRSFTYTMKK